MTWRGSNTWSASGGSSSRELRHWALLSSTSTSKTFYRPVYEGVALYVKLQIGKSGSAVVIQFKSRFGIDEKDDQ